MCCFCVSCEIAPTNGSYSQCTKHGNIIFHHIAHWTLALSWLQLYILSVMVCRCDLVCGVCVYARANVLHISNIKYQLHFSFALFSTCILWARYIHAFSTWKQFSAARPISYNFIYSFAQFKSTITNKLHSSCFACTHCSSRHEPHKISHAI